MASEPRDGRRALVVASEASVRQSVCIDLEQRGHQVVQAEDQASAVDVIMAAVRLDVAIVDLRLSQGNGLEVAKLLHLAQPDCDIRLISNELTPSVEQAARELEIRCHRQHVEASDLLAGVRSCTLPEHNSTQEESEAP